MIPVKQRANDDCFRACLASLAETQLEAIPHFFAGLRNGEHIAPDTRAMIDDWFRARGFVLIRFPIPADNQEHALWVMHESNPGAHYILTGRSRKMLDHAVVAKDGYVVHDPATPARELIPHVSGMYGVCMIGCLI